jgi:hypothetical protein
MWTRSTSLSCFLELDDGATLSGSLRPTRGHGPSRRRLEFCSPPRSIWRTDLLQTGFERPFLPGFRLFNRAESAKFIVFRMRLEVYRLFNN